LAVTVSHVSAVDRMVSKEYVQTAHPYDRDLATLGAWGEIKDVLPGVLWWAAVTVFVTGTGILARGVVARLLKILPDMLVALARADVMLQDPRARARPTCQEGRNQLTVLVD
jgi:hypothetical protein